jgi:hypothetical protein
MYQRLALLAHAMHTAQRRSATNRLTRDVWVGWDAPRPDGPQNARFVFLKSV